MLSHLNNLNNEQKEAALSRGLVCCIAGAGTGKTTTLVSAILDREKQDRCNPDNILVVTFTRKASKEMKDRLLALGGPSSIPRYIGSFHSISLSLMMRFPGLTNGIDKVDVIDEREREKLIKEAIIANVLPDLTLDNKQIKTLTAAFGDCVSEFKSRLITPEDIMNNPALIESVVQSKEYEEEIEEAVFECLQKHYSTYLSICHHDMKVMDFDDLIMLPVLAMRGNPALHRSVSGLFRYVLADEYQDSNFAQKAWLEMMASSSGELFVVGDDGQSIYGWRGAKVEFIRSIYDDPRSSKILLVDNHRCSKNIADLGNDVISLDTSTIPKKLRACGKTRDEPTLVRIDEYSSEKEECKHIAKKISDLINSGVPPENIAVLSRTNRYVTMIDKALVNHGVASCADTVGFYDLKEIRYLIAYLRMVVNPDEGRINLVAPDIFGTPLVATGIGKRTIENLENISMGTRSDDMPMVGMVAIMRDMILSDPESKESIKLKLFVDTIDECVDKTRAIIASSGTVKDIIEFIARRSGLLDSLQTKQLALFEDIQRIKDQMARAGSREEMAELIAEKTRKEDACDEVSNRIQNINEFICSDTNEYETIQDLLNAVTIDRPDVVNDNNENVGVRVMTMHGAKGLEWEYVFIVGGSDKMMGSAELRDGDVCMNSKQEEACRVAYVAVTRAKRVLNISYSAFVYGKEQTGLSLFFRLGRNLDIRKHDNFGMKAHFQTKANNGEFDEFDQTPRFNQKAVRRYFNG